MEFEKVAHMVVFGETFSGKTYYTKHLINKLNPTKIFVFTGSPHEWNDLIVNNVPANVYTDSFDENTTKMIAECTEIMNTERLKPDFEPHCPHVVVFDDFNEEINTKTNELYKSLYTRGRHYGIRVINLAHQSHAIGPLARANARYIFILSSTSETELEELAGLFYGKMHLQLKNIASNAYAENKYNCIIIDKRTKQHVIDCAPRARDSNKTLANKFIGAFDIDLDTELPPASALNQDPASAHYMGVANPTLISNFGTKTAHNMVDNSINNFNVNHNIKMKQLVESNNVHNEIKLQNLMFDVKLKLREDVLNVRDIIHKPFKTPQEKEKLVHVMNKTLRPSPPFTTLDYEEGIPTFMNVYFKEKYNNKKPTVTSVVEKAGDLMLCNQNEPISLATSGWNLLQTAIKSQVEHRNREVSKYDKLLSNNMYAQRGNKNQLKNKRYY